MELFNIYQELVVIPFDLLPNMWHFGRIPADCLQMIIDRVKDYGAIKNSLYRVCSGFRKIFQVKAAYYNINKYKELVNLHKLEELLIFRYLENTKINKIKFWGTDEYETAHLKISSSKKIFVGNYLYKIL